MKKDEQSLVAYCGLYCPKCYKMVVSEAAKLLEEALENTHICGSVHDPSKQFKKELKILAGLRCPKLCKAGGGKPDCKIRVCCLSKNLEGCWECKDFENCKNLKKQFVENLRKIKNRGLSDFIREADKPKKIAPTGVNNG
jgi:hypothetical protein